ncbi:hypothetical protein [Streptomyces sp. NBC_01353]|uniref:hypothetical protein n=1 Tax=Streptomyces sp. NBC_01353 TaxID=2903835 RepID=UPI002E36F366|nr:hypothetical protein [Streptomyces sp. NBC_01353]
MAKADGTNTATPPREAGRHQYRHPASRGGQWCDTAHALTKARPRAAIVVITALAGLSFSYGVYALTMAYMPL